MLKNQHYSDLVFKNVIRLAGEDQDIARRYKSLCKRAGGIFRTVGLVQFATFIEAKGKKEKYYQWLSEHLQRELNDVQAIKSSNSSEYLEKIRKLSLPDYMNMSRVVLQLLQWHKRIAEILIEGTADEGDE